jgi:RNA polymerase-binding protein DksA
MPTGKINVQRFKKRLLEERDRLEAEMRRVEPGEEESQSDEVGELSHYDEHTADSATETFQRERDMAIGDNLKLMLEQVTDALHKIDNGTYGLCDRCHQPIATGRLEALPYATLCIECAERMQGRM